jgi:ubiquinone/menaquinone biosynthesis C-methylase UbiE
MTEIDQRLTSATQARYDRIAPIYDLMEIFPEIRYKSWRERFWKKVKQNLPLDDHFLEVGVGTGKNIPYWPKGAQITAIDLTPRMLNRTAQRVEHLGLSAQLALGDVQDLNYPDNSFDLAAATFVFCSVPDPVKGMNELARVVKPLGTILLMEHVRSSHPLIGKLMDLFNPVVVRTMGPNINRDTVEKVHRSDLFLENVENLGAGGIFKLITARVPSAKNGGAA